MTSGIGCKKLANENGRRRVRRGVGSYIGAPVQQAIGRNPSLLTTSERLYLDHAATTPVLPAARAAMAQALEGWANPSSPHADGRRARAALEQARREIAEALAWRHDVILTSGASEAVQIVAARVKAKRRIVGSTEHDAVIAAMGEPAEVLAVDGNGLIDQPALERLLADEPALVAVQLVNNETGVIQPLERVYEIVREAGSLLLCDCAQAAGKIALPDADFIAISGHKFGGPPGAGRAAGEGPRDARAERRAGEGLSARDREFAGRRREWPRRSRPRLRRCVAATDALREQLEREIIASGAS